MHGFLEEQIMLDSHRFLLPSIQTYFICSQCQAHDQAQSTRCFCLGCGTLKELDIQRIFFNGGGCGLESTGVEVSHVTGGRCPEVVRPAAMSVQLGSTAVLSRFPGEVWLNSTPFCSCLNPAFHSSISVGFQTLLE